MGTKTVSDEQILEALKDESKTRGQVSKELGIAHRTLVMRIQKMRKQGVKIPGVYKNYRNVQSRTLCPTNEERLSHLDLKWRY